MASSKPQFGVAVDQYGQSWRFGRHCRKDLSEQIPGRVHKLYADDTQQRAYHVGYVIGDHWLTIYTPWKGPV